MKETIEDIINRLTINNQYGSDICLLLLLNDRYTSIYYLDYLDIKGQELENLKNCCKEISVPYLTQTIRFLRSGFLSKEEIKENLNYETPVPFIDRLLNIDDNWERVYEHYAYTFRKELSNKRKDSNKR